MTSNQNDNTDPPMDGFDLIKYPCDYGFKAMCRVDSCSEQSAAEVMRELVLRHVPESRLIATHTKESRTGKFESVTITVRLSAREELEAIYQSVAASTIVVMTL